MRVRLLHRNLHYRPEFVLHTASSGAVAALSTLYLAIEDDDGLHSVGEVRENIEYLSGIPASEVRRDALSLLRRLDWRLPPEQILHALHQPHAECAVATALFDTALHDWMARRRCVPICTMLSGASLKPSPSNQTLFFSSMEVFEARARSYVERGFTDLKLRIGRADFGEDLMRFKRLRAMFGDSVSLSADANGAWTEAEALKNIAQLALYDLAYIEQPIPAGDWPALRRLAQATGVLVMADESLKAPADLDALIGCDGYVGGHLKIVKAGGIGPLFAAGERLNALGVPLMVGQMNEGAGATAAAAQLALALNAGKRELYGADGLIGDPVRGLGYVAGTVSISGDAGLGVEFTGAGTSLLGTLEP